MSIVKRGGKYYVDIVRPDGSRLRKSTGTQDRKLAQEYHDKLKHEAWQEKRLGVLPDMTWEEAAVRWLEELEARGRKGDLRSTATRIKWMTKHFAGMTLKQMTQPVVMRVLEEKRRESSGATANRHLAAVRSILKRATYHWGTLNQCPKLTMFEEPKRRVRWLSADEVKALLRELPEGLRAASEFAMLTGLRTKNIRDLRWQQIDLQRRVIRIDGDEMKNGESHSVPLNDRAVEVIRAQLGKHQTYVFVYKGKRRADNFNTRAWRNALKRAGIADFRFHDWRHVWATTHINAGTPLHVLQELGGWKSVNMVRRYAFMVTDHLSQYANNSSALLTTAQPQLRVVGGDTKMAQPS